MAMAQDGNQRKFGTRLSVSIHPFRTGLFATETAFIQLGLQSTAPGPHYLQLNGRRAKDYFNLILGCLYREGLPAWNIGEETVSMSQ